MSRAVTAGAALLAVIASACSTTHSLPRPAPPRPVTRACAIGVARFADEYEVDHALDLRDHLRAAGVCSRVVLVTEESASSVDLVVRGTVRTSLSPAPGTPLTSAGSAFTGLGIGLLVGGAVVKGVVGRSPAPDAHGFVNPSSRSTANTAGDYGTAGLVSGGVTAALGITALVVDGAALREITLRATVDADVTMTRGDRTVAHATWHDEVTARGKHPSDRPEARESPASRGPLYREAMRRVFEGVTVRVADALLEEPSPGGPVR